MDDEQILVLTQSKRAVEQTEMRNTIGAKKCLSFAPLVILVLRLEEDDEGNEQFSFQAEITTDAKIGELKQSQLSRDKSKLFVLGHVLEGETQVSK